jgi:uncharacterized membrane protein (UPF0182 family)
VGSRVIRGNLLVIPIENSILYVEPLYLLAEQSQLPELKRVIVVYEDKIVMEEDLQTALSKIFGTEVPEPSGPISGEVIMGEELASQALIYYNRALEELKAGNWNEFGENLRALEEVLNELKEMEES